MGSGATTEIEGKTKQIQQDRDDGKLQQIQQDRAGRRQADRQTDRLDESSLSTKF